MLAMMNKLKVTQLSLSNIKKQLKHSYRMLRNLHAIISVLTVLSSDSGVWLALAQLAETGGTAAAGDGGPAPAALLLPQSGTAHRDALGTGDAAGQAGDASSAAAAAGHCHLSGAGLLGEGLG